MKPIEISAPSFCSSGRTSVSSSSQGSANSHIEFGYLCTFMVQKDAFYAQIEQSKQRLASGVLNLSEAGGECNDHNEGGCASAVFLDSFEAEVFRLTKTIKTQHESQELSAKALLSNVDAVVNSSGGTNPEAIKELRAKADDQAIIALQLQRFVKQNAKILSDIASQADSELNTPCGIFLSRNLSKSPWVEGPNSTLIVVLSDIYEDLRSAENRNKKEDSKWVAPSSFERSTTKYWVREDKLTELLLATVTQAPLLVYGRSGHLTTKSDLSKTEGNKLWDELAAPINSVYFDSPTMSLYRERIKRSEGAQLFRVRWYGNKPTGDELVFLELKTHHEKWIDEKSVKQRVNIQEKDMRTFLSSKHWSPEVAEKLVLAAEPKLSRKNLEKQVGLLSTMHDLIISKNLRPCVRSVYVRAAFQSPSSNALRLTLDRNVTLIDEKQAPLGNWCLPDNSNVMTEGIARVPYAVFEIKLSNSEMPPVFQDLIDNGALIEAPKFSKFLSGAAAFNAHNVTELPYWAEEPVFKGMFKSSSQHFGGLHHRAGVTTTSDEIEFDRVSQKFTLLDIDQLYDDISCHDVEAAKQPELTEPVKEISRTSGTGIGLIHRIWGRDSEPKVAPRRRARVEPKSFFANERTFIQWISAALLLVTVSVILLDFQNGNQLGSTPGIVLNAVAVLIVFWAVITYFRRLRLLQSASPYGYVDHFGPILLSAAVLLGVIILLTYYIKAPYEEPQPEPTNNLRGPFLNPAPGHCFNHPINGASNLMYQPSGILVDDNTRQLVVPSLDRITSLSTTHPNNTVEILLQIPSADLEGVTRVGDRIFAVGEAETNPVLYELSAMSNTSTLELAGSWELEGLRSGRAEGITFVPSNHPGIVPTLPGNFSDGVNPGLLYVSGDVNDPSSPENRGIINAYEIPTPNSKKMLSPKGTLNRNLLNSGLDDSKIGDLHFFDGIFYVLNDNERVIRAWDLESGNHLFTTKLPRVKGKFDDQWEGMALQHYDPPQANQMNATLLGQLQLHLALDTPAQVWTFVVREQVDDAGITIPGSIVFPPCAAAN